jgi:hypothetical protein
LDSFLFFVPGYSLMKAQRRAYHLECTLTIDIDQVKANIFVTTHVVSLKLFRLKVPRFTVHRSKVLTAEP